MSVFLYTLISNVFIAFVLITLLYFANRILYKISHKIDYIVSFTVGLLLWIIFLWFLPKIASNLHSVSIGLYILLWLFSFYLLELFVHWHHCKDLEKNSIHCKEAHSHWVLMFFWTFLHNFIHWVVLFASYSVSLPFGIATTLAISLHSIPQNVANLIMNQENYKLVYIAALSGIIGALSTYPFYEILLKYKFYLLAFISGGLIYIALADIFPALKESHVLRDKFINFVLIVFWILVFLWIEYLSSLI